MSSHDPVESLLSRLQRVQQRGAGWEASCPVPSHGRGNGDVHPSLSINRGKNGCAVLTCRGGCETTAILDALGLRMADLFTDSRRHGAPSSQKPFEHSNSPSNGPESQANDGQSGDRTAFEQASNGTADEDAFTPALTVQELADAKQLPAEFLRTMGCSDVPYQGGHAVRMVYPNADGTAGPVRYRVALEKPQHGDRFRWKIRSKVQMLGLDRLHVARDAGHVVMVEGETDYYTLAYAGIPAVGIAGANNYRDDRDAPHLEGIETVYAVVEPDAGGDVFRKRLGESSIRDRVRFIDLSRFGAKDPSALWCDDAARFAERFEQARVEAVPWSDIDADARRAAAAEAYEAAAELLHTPDILAHVGNTFRSMGYAGDLQPAVMAYVAITSRLLSQPLNIAFIAPSGAGKNHAVDTARRLIPEDAVVEYKAASERAMIYDDAVFTHRVVLFSEADSIPEDGPAASAVRNLATDQVMAYDVVEKDETGRFSTRHIVKPGPTSLMTTSTRSLAHQFDTRLLEVTISDSEEQTRAVMAAHAAAVMPDTATALDTVAFVALQQWLDVAGAHDVAVPFGDALARMVPARAVRMRRDFRQLLTFVQTVALLHQLQRERTAEGWVIATLADYAAARELLVTTFNIATSDGLTPAVRETVEAIGPDEEVTQQTLGERLNLSKSTVTHRVKRAIAGGWVVNNETRRGHPHKLARGTPLPEVAHALPTAEELRAELDRFVGSSGGVRREFEPGVNPESPETTGKSASKFECSNQSGEERETPLVNYMFREGYTSGTRRAANGRVKV